MISVSLCAALLFHSYFLRVGWLRLHSCAHAAVSGQEAVGLLSAFQSSARLAAVSGCSLRSADSKACCLGLGPARPLGEIEGSLSGGIADAGCWSAGFEFGLGCLTIFAAQHLQDSCSSGS